MMDTDTQPVCISGVATVTPFSSDWAEVYRAAARGEVAFEPWEHNLEPPHAGARLGLVRQYPKDRYFNERQLRLMDRAMAIAATATGLALEDAGLVDRAASHPDDFATLFASMRGEIPSLYKFGTPLFEGRCTFNPALFPMIARNISCGQAALRFGLRGWSSMLSCGEVSGMHAVARGLELVRSGRSPHAVVCAYEVLSKLSLHQTQRRWSKLGLEPGAARGHSAVPVEGACVLLLEPLASVRARGGRAYATLHDVEHGFLRGEPAESARAVARRWVDRPGLLIGERIDLVGRGCGVGAVSAGELEQALYDAMAEVRPLGDSLDSRQQLGDAGSVSALQQLACLARALGDAGPAPGLQARPAHDARTAASSPRLALAIQATDRHAYSLALLGHAGAAP
jgi:3-oxoacyl-[acyl-carrier-protein] synthase II